MVAWISDRCEARPPRFSRAAPDDIVAGTAPRKRRAPVWPDSRTARAELWRLRVSGILPGGHVSFRARARYRPPSADFSDLDPACRAAECGIRLAPGNVRAGQDGQKRHSRGGFREGPFVPFEVHQYPDEDEIF